MPHILPTFLPTTAFLTGDASVAIATRVFGPRTPPDTGGGGVTNGDSHDHNGGDGAQINHTTLSNIGTNTHAQIDTHIASTANPHSTSDANLVTTDATTNNVSTSKHGFAPKGDGSTTKFLNANGAYSTPAGGGGGFALTTVEANLGSAPHRSGRFTITDSGMTAGAAVLIQQANGPYTGKGTREDEAEMDQVLVTGKVLDATTIQCFWQSRFKVKGNFGFNYSVSG